MKQYVQVSIALNRELMHNTKIGLSGNMKRIECTGHFSRNGRYMGKKDSFDGFEAVGHIADLVNEAISSGDYSSLNRQITEALNEAADAVHDSLTGAVLGDKKKQPYYRTEGGKTYRAESASSYADAQSKVRHTDSYNDAKAAILGGDGVVSAAGSYVRAILGGVLGISFLVPLIAGIALSFSDPTMFPFALFLGAITGLAGWNLFKGIKKIGLIRRARKVLKMMENRDTVTIKEVAAAFGRTEKEVADDLQDMIRENVFTGKAYMDKEQTAFMTSHTAYEQYLETMKQYELRKKEEKSVFKDSDLKEYRKMEEAIDARQKSDAKKAARLSKEMMEMVEEGKAFIAHIHQKNEEIPGEEFTGKLNRLEKIVTNIFDRVMEAPESAPDMHRLMKYYLPTTQKLVDTYATLDRQSVQGENIENAKREIEDSLDTINDAFEKFLDSFYQTTAWDVSSDISVMGQMMAQDGLTGGNEFARAGSKPARPASSESAVPAAEEPSSEAAPAGGSFTSSYSSWGGSAAAAAPAEDAEEKI